MKILKLRMNFYLFKITANRVHIKKIRNPLKLNPVASISISQLCTIIVTFKSKNRLFKRFFS